jgi:hypothetical protein
MSFEAINAIQTEYKGCLFRSRLEARWAVFFDELNVDWLYEPEGFLVGCHEKRPYLPDFYLPKLKLWVEVKGNMASIDYTLLGDACDGFSHCLPESFNWTLPGYESGAAILILGPLPPGDNYKRPWHPFIHNHKSALFTYATWMWDLSDFPDEWSLETLTRLKRKWAEEHPYSDFGKSDAGYYDATSQDLCLYDRDYGLDYVYSTEAMPEYLRYAYTAARSARFEHGHSGATL